MPDIEELTDTKGQTISERKLSYVLFTTMDLTYAYRQLPLIQVFPNHCNFAMVGVKHSGTSRLKKRFSGLRTLPAELQRAMDSILRNFPDAHEFIDDILVLYKKHSSLAHCFHC